MNKINLKCFATLADLQPENADNFSIKADTNIKSLMKQIGLKAEDVKIVFVNGVIVKWDAKLKDGDRVGFFPAVGGG